MGGREKVSLSFMCVIAPIKPLIGLMIAFYRSGCAVFRFIKEHCSTHHGDAHYVAVLFSHIRYVLKIPCI